MHYVFVEYALEPPADQEFLGFWETLPFPAAGQSDVRLLRSSQQAGLMLEIWTFGRREDAERFADAERGRRTTPPWSLADDRLSIAWDKLRIWTFESVHERPDGTT